jgi:alcohol dehydrogenase class IV
VNYMGANAKPITAKVLPHIAIPTTAGTGSEVTTSAVLDNPQTHMKASIVTPLVYPRVAIVDPELTYSMPTKITAMTGFDALTHGIESYLNSARSSLASDIFALETVRLVTQNLGRVVENGDDRKARACMSWAATLGGISISVSSVTVAHGMGLPLGSRFHVPHGLGLSRLLPVVLAHSWQAQPARYAVLADLVGATKAGMDENEKAQTLAVWLKDFIKKIGLDSMWIDLGIDGAGLDQLTDDVFGYMGRLVQVHRPIFDKTQIRELFEKAIR